MTKFTSDIADPQPTEAIKSQKVDMEELIRSAGRGTIWQLAGAVCETVIQMGASAVLARVLFPQDFGMLGMALLFKGLIARIGSLGTASGVIAKKDINQDDLSVAFWMGITVNGFLFLVAFICAPLAARYFHPSENLDPVQFGTNLTLVIKVVAVTFLLGAMGGTSGTLLHKRLRFGTMKIIEVAGFALQSAVAIILAVVFDFNYWALVIAILISSLAISIAKLICAQWLPDFRFSRESFHYLFRFGIHGLGTSMVQYFRSNIDYLLVGRFLGPVSLGLYEFAYRIPHMTLDRLAYPVSLVLFPTLSQVQKDDLRLARGYLRAVRIIAFIVFPMLAGLAVVAYHAVALLWGQRWLPIVFALQLLCLRAAISSVLISIDAIFLCKNRPDLPFKFGLLEFAVTFAVVGVLGYRFGLNGVALGMVIGVLPGLYMAHFALRMVHQSIWQLAWALWPPLAATMGCAALALGATMITEALDLPHWGILAAAVPAGFLAYLGVLFFGFPDQIKMIKETISLVLRRSSAAQQIETPKIS